MKYKSTFLFLLVSTNILYAQIATIEPYDASRKDPALVEFLIDLKDISKRKSLEDLSPLIASKCYTSNEGGETTDPRGFMEYYSSDYVTERALWGALNFCFRIGGGDFKTNNEGELEYFMPYSAANLFNTIHFQSLASYVIALKEQTLVYSMKNTKSQIIDTLCYDMVPINYLQYETNWVNVILNDEREGFIKANEVIYTIDTRCGLIKESGVWKLRFADSFD